MKELERLLAPSLTTFLITATIAGGRGAAPQLLLPPPRPAPARPPPPRLPVRGGPPLSGGGDGFGGVPPHDLCHASQTHGCGALNVFSSNWICRQSVVILLNGTR